MKLIANQMHASQSKENFNFLNRYISPDPSRITKGISTKANTHRKMLTSGVDGILCSTQDGREATHFFKDQDEDILRYCQKCAIMLASKGFNVEKLSKAPMSHRSHVTQQVVNSTRKVKRQQQKGCSIKQRLNKVQVLKENIQICEKQLQSKQVQVESNLIQSGDRYSDMINQVNSYFRIIEHLVEYQKYLAYNRVLTQRVNNQRQLRSFKQSLSELKQTIILIKQDLIDNQDVVLTVTSQQFDSIIDNYNHTVNSVPQILNSQPQIQPILNLTLPPVPEILDQLVDSITFVRQTNIYHPHQSSFKDLRNIVGFSTEQEKNPSSNRDRSPILHLNLNSLHQMEEGQESIYEDDSSIVSQHSFSMKSAFQRDAMGVSKMPTCSKQILLQNSFSVASSIVNEQCGISDEQNDEHVTGSYEPQKFNRQAGISYLQRPKWKSGLNKMEQSLGQYMMTDQTLMLNQTEHDRSQTFLLNH